MANPPFVPTLGARLGSVRSYGIALGITVVAILSPYAVPAGAPTIGPIFHSLISGLAIVYGIPIAAYAFLVGLSPLRNAFRRMGRATWEGFRFTGSFLVLGFLVDATLLAIYSALDPSALKLLMRPNPALQAAASNPYFWIAFSFVVGAVEETIFRGWVFGYWLARGGRNTLAHAVWTSALFASVHLYYGTTYGVIAPIQFTQLFLIGFAFALTYRSSGGNLVIVALLHGVNDAAAFGSLLTPYASEWYLLMVAAIGLVVALVHFVGGDPWGPPRFGRGPRTWTPTGPPSVFPPVPGSPPDPFASFPYPPPEWRGVPPPPPDPPSEDSPR